MSATAPRTTPKAPAPVEPKNVSRSGATARRKTGDFLRAVAPLRENSSSTIVPPTITLGRRAEQVLADHRLNRFDSRTITTSNGAPLPVAVKNPLSRSFSIDLTPIRVHTDAHAQLTVRRLNTRAFAYANHIFLGPGESPGDLRLMAHEVAHVVQQSRGAVLQHFTTSHGNALEHEAERASAAVMRGHRFTVQQRANPRPQGLFGISLPNPLTWLANRVNSIPGFRMLTIILGMNPVNGAAVPRTAANILRAMVELIPGGGLITQALDNYGIFDRVGGFVEEQISSLGMTAGVIRNAVTGFISSLSPSDILHLGGVWDRAVRIFSSPIDRIISVGRRLVTGIVGFIKDAILQPLARLASQTRGWNLLIAVLGRNPITGEAVPRNAETLIGGFMRLIGQEEVWTNLQQARAAPRAWAWFQDALSGLLNFVSEIPTLFIQALRSLELVDIVLLPRAFVRVGSVFGNFVGRFISWAGEQVFSLLQIIFEVLAPLAMPYIRRATSALRTIFRDPIGFIGNLVRAGIQGFRQFGTNFLTHLRASLIGWLTGAMSGANIYIPQGFNFQEIVKFVLSVLGLTWQNIRTKLVRAIGETAVRVLETGFQLVVTLVTQGPAAAWEQIQQGLTNLREMVMEQVMTFVRDRIVTAAITRLLTSLNPAGAFIQAVIAIYNTVMFFVERLRQIAQVAMSFIDSMAAIASGNITAAANRVEQTMAGLLTLVISFLARLVGLGRVSDAVIRVINRVRAPIDRALDRVVEWIVAQARRLGRAVSGAARRVIAWWRTRRRFRGADGQQHTITVDRSGSRAVIEVRSERKTIEQLIAEATGPQRQTLQRYFEEINEIISHNAATEASETDQQTFHTRIENAVTQIVAALGTASPQRHTVVTWTFGEFNRARRMIADPLTMVEGNTHSEEAQNALRFREYYEALVEESAMRRQPIHGTHLLADTLHGPVLPWNIANAPRGGNMRMRTPEGLVRSHRNPPQNKEVRYVVTVTYFQESAAHRPPPIAQARTGSVEEKRNWLKFITARRFEIALQVNETRTIVPVSAIDLNVDLDTLLPLRGGPGTPSRKESVLALIQSTVAIGGLVPGTPTLRSNLSASGIPIGDGTLRGILSDLATEGELNPDGDRFRRAR